MFHRRRSFRFWRRTPIAWLNLAHARVRLLVATSGISFSVILIFMQLGFFGAVLTNARLIYDNLNFDILLMSRKTLDATVTQPFALQHLYRAGGIQGVQQVMPFYTGFKQWRHPETKRTRAILLMGFNPKDAAIKISEVNQQRDLLSRQDTVLMDRLSRAEFGPQTVGLQTELAQRQVELVGLFTMGAGLRFDGTVALSDQNFVRLFPGRSLNDVSLGLITVQPGADIDAIMHQLRQELPGNIEVLSRAAAAARDQRYWVVSTSVGYIFGTGAIMGFVVGTVIVYQILYTDVTEHLHEYVTLKAIGYSNVRLAKVVLQEAVILALLGYAPGFLISLGLYQITFLATHLPIFMTLERAALVGGLTLLMCVCSSIFSLRKVFAVSPADVFSS